MTNKQATSINHNVAMLMEFLRYSSGISVIWYFFEPLFPRIVWGLTVFIIILGALLFVSSLKKKNNEDRCPNIKKHCFWVRPTLNLVRNYSPILAIILFIEKHNLIQYTTPTNTTELIYNVIYYTFWTIGLILVSFGVIPTFLYDLDKEKAGAAGKIKNFQYPIAITVLVLTTGCVLFFHQKINKKTSKSEYQITQTTSIPKQQPIPVPIEQLVLIKQVKQPKLTHNFKKTATTTSKYKKFIKRRKRC